MSVSSLFHATPRDPRAVPCFIALLELRHHPERGDAVYRQRLETLSDDQITALAGDAGCHAFMGRRKLLEMLRAMTARQLDFQCLPREFTLPNKETT